MTNNSLFCGATIIGAIGIMGVIGVIGSAEKSEKIGVERLR